MQPDPIIFSMLFEGTENGKVVIDHLTHKYWKNPYVAGDPNQTAFNAGAMSVLDYIIEQLNEAHKND